MLDGAFRTVRKSPPFEIDAMVVVPGHLLCIWTPPPGDADFATRWRLVKAWFTRHCDPGWRHVPGPARLAKRQQAVWHHRYWEHQLRDAADFVHHVDYIHHTPVKHGLSPLDWPYSICRRQLAAGIYPADWGQCTM